MMLQKKRFTGALLLSGSLLCVGCIPQSNDDENALTESPCDTGQKHMHTSDGRTLCIALSADTANMPFMAGFKAPGKVVHTVEITDADSGTPVDLTTDTYLTAINQYPMMYMNSGHMHSAPFKHMADTTDAANGRYQFTTYYLMPSAMNGTPMGRWEYRVSLTDIGTDAIAGNSDDTMHIVTFEPDVSMVMGGNTFKVNAARADDYLADHMGETITRNYAVWLDSVGKNNDSTHELSLFISVTDPLGNVMMSHAGAHEMETDSMHYPGFYAGQTLHDENGNTVSVDDVQVQVTTVATPVESDWTSLTPQASLGEQYQGYYAGTVSGLSTTEQNSLQVRVLVSTTHLIDTVPTANDAQMTLRGGGDIVLKFTAPAM